MTDRSKLLALAEIEPELVERMVALLRQQVASLEGEKNVRPAVEEARAIVAALPKPVDPDLREARGCVAQIYEAAGRHDLADATRLGRQDSRLRVQSALAAIKRGRELAQAEALS